MKREGNSQHIKRIVLAMTLFICAIGSTFVINAIGNRHEKFWVAKHSIAPGAIIKAADLTLTSASLQGIRSQYLTEEANLIGSIALSQISEGEFIPLSRVSDDPFVDSVELVPITIRTSDIPADLAIGEEVNIYWVPESNGTQVIGEPQRVMDGVYLRSIDRKGSNFGNDLAITVSVASEDVVNLLSTTVTGRLVIVRSHG